MAKKSWLREMCAPLFPELEGSSRGLVGIARLVAEGEAVDKGHAVTFRSIHARSILNRAVSRRGLGFARSINPYRGCEFACRYCYARYTHEFMELKQPEDFERQIFIKRNAAWLLRQELRDLGANEEIAIGTATDPYQPIERRARVTRSLLEVLAQCRGRRIGIVTKSTLIARDIELLVEIAARNRLVLHITVTTADTALARILEPRAPRPDLRFETVAKLRAAGLHAGVLCSPLLPGITDYPAALETVAAAAHRADAGFFCAQPLFLKACAKPTYLAFVREHFPALEPMYRARFEDTAFVSRAYAQRLRQMVRAVCARHGLVERSGDALLTRETESSGMERGADATAQGSLFPPAMLPARAVPRHHQRVMMVS